MTQVWLVPLIQALFNVIIFLVLAFVIVKLKLVQKFIEKSGIIPNLRFHEAKIESLRRHLDHAGERETRLVSELNLYRDVEPMIKIGFFNWNLAKIPDEVVCSPNFLKIFDVPNGLPMTGKDFIDIIVEEDRAKVNQVIDNAWKNGLEYTMDYHIGKRNLKAIHVRCWGSPIKISGEPNPIGFKGAIQIIDDADTRSTPRLPGDTK